ncbi:MAG: amidohydrolase family protein [Caulobacteraceae bacterium]
MAQASLEDVLEPDLPIVDPHHHLWDRPRGRPAETTPVRHGFENVGRLAPRYLLDELMADIGGGHNVRATVFVECRAFYRQDGPEELRCVGETEFVNGVAAMGASGVYGEARPCAGIVGHADLDRGAAAQEPLEALLAAGGGRFRGVRHAASWDADPAVLGPLSRGRPGLYGDPKFREGFARLAPLGLSFDAWLLERQLADLIDLAWAFEETSIVLDHVGTPLGIGAYQGKREERFSAWRASMKELARSPNVFVKLGGLAMPFAGFSSFMASPPASSETLAAEWKPYIETSIETFGTGRCMFESNFPVDLCTASYRTLWNVFKRLAKGASAEEKADLFFGTASRFYRLPA